jgi:hypothetical protein
VDAKEKSDMSAEASRCFHQAKTNLAAVNAASNAPISGSSLPYRDLRTAHQFAIMAVIAAKGGSPPGEKHKLVSICESIGLWSVMPPKFKEHLIAIDCFEVEPVQSSDEATSGGAAIEQWQERLQTAPKFLFFIENHVVSNPQVLGGLTILS